MKTLIDKDDVFVTSECIDDDGKGSKTYDSIQWKVKEIKSVTIDGKPQPNIIVERIK